MPQKLAKLQTNPLFLTSESQETLFSDGHQPSNSFSFLDPNLSHKFKIPKINTQEAKSIFQELIQKNPFKSASSKKNWKFQETSLLIYLVDKFSSISNVLNVTDLSPQVWQQIQRFLPGRTDQDCKYKVLSMTASTITNIPWSVEERNILTEIISEEGMNWNAVSQRLYERSDKKVFRTSKQCREHYMCFLKPNLKKQNFLYFRGAWTDEEDYKLICFFLEYGRKWSKIMKFIEGRNENSIKNRFFLLFENKGKNNNQSDLLRKVKRKKQRMEKNLKEAALKSQLSVKEKTVEQTKLDKAWEKIERMDLQRSVEEQETKKGQDFQLTEYLVKYEQNHQESHKDLQEAIKGRNGPSVNHFQSFHHFEGGNLQLGLKEASSIEALESFEQYISF